MEDEPSTSKFDNTAEVLLKRWTKNLQFLPEFTFELLRKHLGTELSAGNNPGGAHKHKKLGYLLFKENYVKNVEVKANVYKDKECCFLIKAIVNAAMKNTEYTVYVHLNQENGEILHSKCTCKAGKGGQCKHIVALLFQVIEYNQLDLKEIPNDLTCTQTLQQWHVPRKDECDEAVLYEDLTFVKTSYEKDTSDKKRKANDTSSTTHNSTPHFARQIDSNDIKKLAAALNQSQPCYLRELLESNNFQPHAFEEIHSNLPSKKRCVEMKTDACDIYDSEVRNEMLEQLPQSTLITHKNIL